MYYAATKLTQTLSFFRIRVWSFLPGKQAAMTKMSSGFAHPVNPWLGRAPAAPSTMAGMNNFIVFRQAKSLKPCLNKTQLQDITF
jgi:hypothetical protein